MLRLSHLNSQEVSKFAQVFCLELLQEELFKLLNTKRITSCNDSVINMNY